MNYVIYGTDGLSSFYDDKHLNINNLNLQDIINKIKLNNEIDLLINIPKNIYSNNNNTNGFIMRRKCLDYNIPVITNIKCAKLFVSSLKNYNKNGIDYTSWNDYINVL